MEKNYELTSNPSEWPDPRTQKAKGYRAIWDARPYSWSVPCAYLIQSDEDLEFIIRNGIQEEYNFARPCPTVPRHGFVESGKVHSSGDLREVWAETKEADPLGELLLLQTIDASYSAVYTPGGVFFGRGNDGATAGINSLSMFVPEPTLNDFLPPLKEASGIAEADSPYFELVWAKDRKEPYLVQCRGGDKIPSGIDYIPFNVDVRKIVVAQGVGLEWEEEIAAHAKTPEAYNRQLIVYHEGGNQGSHFAVHCRLNGIPYVASFKPTIGQQIEPTSDEQSEFDLHALMSGINTGSETQCTFEDAVNLMLTGLHTFGTNKGASRDFQAGVGAMACLRLGAAACLGEYRHHQKGGGLLPRRQIFHAVWKDFFHHQKRMTIATRSFKNTHWKPGYGGYKWGQCAEGNVHLWLEILEFMKDPSQLRAKYIMTAFNRAVNEAHNGGWLFNKFTNSSLLDEAGSGNPRAFVRSVPALMEAHAMRVSSLGWRKMRRPRAFSINEDEAGVRHLIMRYERHKDPNATRRGNVQAGITKPKVTVGAIRGIVKHAGMGAYLHLQYKVIGKVQYKTLDIKMSEDKASAISNMPHTSTSMAGSGTAYIPFTAHIMDGNYILRHGVSEQTVDMEGFDSEYPLQMLITKAAQQ